MSSKRCDLGVELNSGKTEGNPTHSPSDNNVAAPDVVVPTGPNLQGLGPGDATSSVTNPLNAGVFPTPPNAQPPQLPQLPPSDDITGDDDDDSKVPMPVMTPKLRRTMEFAIITEITVGTPIEIIAKNYKIDIKYAAKLRNEWLKACKLQESFDYRTDLKRLSVDAIRDGLNARGDLYKRMNGGIRVMQGIGEFKSDQVNVTVLQRLENVPPELRDRFVTVTSEDEKNVVEGEVISSS